MARLGDGFGVNAVTREFIQNRRTVPRWNDEELRLAPVKIGLFHRQTDSELMVPFVFLDLGAGRNHLDLAGIQRSWLEMVSTGPGLTWQFARNAALRFTWGFPLIRNGHTGPFLGPQFGAQITF